MIRTHHVGRWILLRPPSRSLHVEILLGPMSREISHLSQGAVEWGRGKDVLILRLGTGLIINGVEI
jgi:hypothetical protein